MDCYLRHMSFLNKYLLLTVHCLFLQELIHGADASQPAAMAQRNSPAAARWADSALFAAIDRVHGSPDTIIPCGSSSAQSDLPSGIDSTVPALFKSPSVGEDLSSSAGEDLEGQEVDDREAGSSAAQRMEMAPCQLPLWKATAARAANTADKVCYAHVTLLITHLQH